MVEKELFQFDSESEFSSIETKPWRVRFFRFERSKVIFQYLLSSFWLANFKHDLEWKRSYVLRPFIMIQNISVVPKTILTDAVGSNEVEIKCK